MAVHHARVIALAAVAVGMEACGGSEPHTRVCGQDRRSEQTVRRSPDNLRLFSHLGVDTVRSPPMGTNGPFTVDSLISRELIYVKERIGRGPVALDDAIDIAPVSSYSSP